MEQKDEYPKLDPEYETLIAEFYQQLKRDTQFYQYATLRIAAYRMWEESQAQLNEEPDEQPTVYSKSVVRTLGTVLKRMVPGKIQQYLDLSITPRNIPAKSVIIDVKPISIEEERKIKDE